VTLRIVVGDLVRMRRAQPATAVTSRARAVLNRSPLAMGPGGRLVAPVEAATEIERLVVKELRLGPVGAVISGLSRLRRRGLVRRAVERLIVGHHPDRNWNNN